LKKKPKSLRERGKRQRGGQKGHDGHTLAMVSEPQHIAVHPLTSCPNCQHDLKFVAVVGVEKRQVFDLPLLGLEVTEHQAEIKCCPDCQAQVKASFPAGVSQAVQYGARLKAQAGYLNSYQLLPLARLCELWGDLYGHTPSQASVLSAIEAVHTQLSPALEALQAQLKQAEVVHCDESGMRVEGKLNWLHVITNQRLTYYGVHPKRGQAAMRAMGILNDFQGCAVHDAWGSYFQFEQCTHALCNAHHLRELRFVAEQYQQDWAESLAQLLLESKHEVESCPPEQMRLSYERLRHYHDSYDRLIQHGFEANPTSAPPVTKQRGRKPQSPAKNLLDRLLKYKAETLAFLSDFCIPFDNNLAERDIRMMKVKQKISGTFRTRIGAEMFCDIRSYISTVRKQGHNVLQALHDALLGRPFIPA
jgi:transposase